MELCTEWDSGLRQISQGELERHAAGNERAMDALLACLVDPEKSVREQAADRDSVMLRRVC